MAALDKRSITFVGLALAILGVSFLIADADLGLTGFLVKGKADLTINVVDGSNNHVVRDARIYVEDIQKDEKSTYAGRTNRRGEKTIRVSAGTYEVKIVKNDYISKTFSILLKDGDERDVNVVLFSEDYKETCSDGTVVETCSSPQPLFCGSSGSLEERCDLCGCVQGHTCRADGSCA